MVFLLMPPLLTTDVGSVRLTTVVVKHDLRQERFRCGDFSADGLDEEANEEWRRSHIEFIEAYENDIDGLVDIVSDIQADKADC